VARRVYTKELSDFDRQVPAIVAARAAIDAVFAPNILRTLDEAGNWMPSQEIWRAILSSSGTNH
jgi:hypothetical protein